WGGWAQGRGVQRGPGGFGTAQARPAVWLKGWGGRGRAVDAWEFARLAFPRVSTPENKATERNRRAPEWERNTRAPVPLPPPKSCDCQFHIFGDPRKYPLRFDVTFKPPRATFADIRKVLRTMGFERGVIVHTQRYDTDHRLLIDELAGLSPQERRNFRAIGIVTDDLS